MQTAPTRLYNKSTDISRKRWSEQMDVENLIGETTEYDKKAALEVKKLVQERKRFCEHAGRCADFRHGG